MPLRKRFIAAIAMLSFCAFANAQVNPEHTVKPLEAFKETTAWVTAGAVSAVGNKLQVTNGDTNQIIVSTPDAVQAQQHLIAKAYLGDNILQMDYLLPEGSQAKIFLMGRYAIELKNKNNEWQTLSLKFRAPRFDEARNKTENPLLLELRINGDVITKNKIFDAVSEGAAINWEDRGGPATMLVERGSFAFRNFTVRAADFSAITLPEETGGTTNESELIDFVALGKETFESVGCNVCHTTSEDSSAVSTGPNLFGLFKPTPRKRDVIEGGEGHRFSIKADISYLHRSLRSPAEQLAIAEQGKKSGTAYPALMPPFSAQVLSDVQIDAIGAYLSTLNKPRDQGPAIKLMSKLGGTKYDPLTDTLQLIVNDEVRIQRGPMEGVSGRAIHVGMVNSVNYSFDPRILGIAKIWQGGFLDMSGEFLNRGGKGLKTGYESREISMEGKEFLFAPLNADGNEIDFSFKDAKFGDVKTIVASLNSKEDHLARVKAVNAQFLGYERDSGNKQAVPTFRYRVGDNVLGVKTTVASNGNTEITVTGSLKTPQKFSVNQQVLKQASVNKGELANSQWTLPAGAVNATLTATITLVNDPWHAEKSAFNYKTQSVKITSATANLPAGYSIENYYPPKDNLGREQLFEALGLALAPDGTIVIGTRTAGIWRIVDGQWKLFAEGTFDSLGLLVEDKKGLVVVAGQKAELTRISDTNGDGLADKYETLFDAHSYHGNYHAYMHGPVRGADGAYYININLADGGDGSTYKANGAYMGTTGGFSGWTFRVEPDGDFKPWTYGLRSPAGIALAPDERLWYAENQGEYVGTSKLFILKPDKFYGHPASLVDLPGMTPESPEIAWDNVLDKREKPVILLPHNRVANSPGNPAWDTTKGKFGAFSGQMFIGDQTQSNLLRVATQMVDGTEQGSVMPFIDGLESGVMRPLFLPDGSLLLGQTGRGWQAKGGHVASLQHIRWNQKTVAPAIKQMLATSEGFSLELTQPLPDMVNEDQLQKAITLESWVYRDAPQYGSDELDAHAESIKNITVSEDRKLIHLALASLVQPKVHPQQTARVYHAKFAAPELFKAAAREMDAYYTLYKFPGTDK